MLIYQLHWVAQKFLYPLQLGNETADIYVWKVSTSAPCCMARAPQTSGGARRCSWVAPQVTGPRGSTLSLRGNLFMSTDRDTLWSEGQDKGRMCRCQRSSAAKNSTPLLAPLQKIPTIIIIHLSHNGTTFCVSPSCEYEDFCWEYDAV